MYRSFCLVVVLFLCSSPFIVSAQIKSAKEQPQVETKRSQVDRAATTPSSTERSERTENARKSYRLGLTFFDAGQLLPAADSFREAIQFDPEFADAYSALGRTYFKLQEWQKAFDTLQRASALNSKRKEVSEANTKTSNEEKGEASKSPVNSLAAQSISPPPVRVDRVPTQASPAVQNAPSSAPRSMQAQPNHATVVNRLNVNSETDSNKQNLSRVPKVPVLPKAIKIGAGAPMTVVAGLSDIGLRPVFSLKLATVSEVFSEEPPVVEQAAVGTQVSQPATAPPAISSANGPATLVTPSAEISPTKIYRVGPNDVLDVRLSNNPGQQSTLFTITPAGLLEYPMLAEPMLVSGLTAEEIGAQIEKDLVKRAIAENPKAVVGVRDYASHAVLVSGLVKESGTKYLRREGIPLYVVIADAQPLPEAARVTVVSVDNQTREIDLDDATEMNVLVRSGDVITLSPHTTQFVYIGGEIKVPGEKTFRRGLTLLQVVLASGGLNSKAKFAEIARVDDKGFLVPTRFQLKEIMSGNAVDPILKPGDRISILH